MAYCRLHSLMARSDFRRGWQPGPPHTEAGWKWLASGFREELPVCQHSGGAGSQLFVQMNSYILLGKGMFVTAPSSSTMTDTKSGMD